MTLRGREREAQQLSRWFDKGASPIVVWGAPGIGTSALVRETLPELPHIDARDLDTLPHDADVIWDGVRPEVAREALRRRPRRVVVTTRSPLGVDGEHTLEVGPLAMEHATALLEERLSNAGHQVHPTDLERIVLSTDGIPMVIEHAARAFELLGVDGLADPSSREAPHLTALFHRLQEAWQRLTPEDQSALGTLATVNAPIRPTFVRVLLGERGLHTLRRLRDASWLHSPRPGTTHLLRPIRRFVRGVSSPSTRGRDRYTDWLLTQASPVDFEILRPRLNKDFPAYADDLREAVRRRPEDPRTVRALRVLAYMQPTSGVEACVTAAREHHPEAAELVLAQVWIDLRQGRLESAYDSLQTLRAVAPDLDPCEREGMCALISIHRRDYPTAQVHFQAKKDVAVRIGSPLRLAEAEFGLGRCHSRMGDLYQARAIYERAVVVLRRLGIAERESTARTNLGVVLTALGHADLARDEFVRAISVLGAYAQAHDAVIHANLGWLCVVQGTPTEGERHLRRALAMLGGQERVRVRAWCLVLWGASKAIVGDATAAIRALDQSEQLLQTTRLVRMLEMVSLCRGFVDIQAGRRDEALRRLNAARQPTRDGQPPFVTIEDDARTAANLLEAQILASPGAVLYIGDADAWVRVHGGERVSLPRSASLRRLLRALTEARLQRRPAVPLAELFMAGWPDDHVPPTTRSNRVQVAVHQLRANGLKDILLHDGSGYLLDATLPILLGGD